MRLKVWRTVAMGLSILLPSLVFGAGAGTAAAQDTRKETRPVIDESKVYFGKAATCKNPAVVDADRVFQAIPEYKRILEKKLTEKDVEYSMLMMKATRKFRVAIEGAATDGGYDLVAQAGAVSWEGHSIPDITDAAILKVEENARRSQ